MTHKKVVHLPASPHQAASAAAGRLPVSAPSLAAYQLLCHVVVIDMPEQRWRSFSLLSVNATSLATGALHWMAWQAAEL